MMAKRLLLILTIVPVILSKKNGQEPSKYVYSQDSSDEEDSIFNIHEIGAYTFEPLHGTIYYSHPLKPHRRSGWPPIGPVQKSVPSKPAEKLIQSFPPLKPSKGWPDVASDPESEPFTHPETLRPRISPLKAIIGWPPIGPY
ncbi:hypothetical protein O3G_MSEX011417 [Manduca sexta]|uniref:Uncharacterized protein n=1 Tax=Manduca sexta TaxID=7130 RepID=A0A922CVL0_MANSE|nr:hypothetical protein O3G_MSEX011417 [Manduca sexta]